MSKQKAYKTCLLLAAAVVACLGCGKILGPSFPATASPRVIVNTPSSPATDAITIRFQLIDREKEPGDVTIEYSTDGAQTFQAATLTATNQATGLVSEWYPGITHAVQWDSVTDTVGISGEAQVCIKVTPSDASNPSGTADITGTFTVDNIAFNQRPSVTVTNPAGVQSGNIQLTYTLTDTEGDTCSIVVEFSINGAAWQEASMGPAGDGLSSLSSSPGGTSHTFLWDSRTDNVGSTVQQNNVKVRITPEDFNTGTAVATSSFSVNNSVPNNPPTVSITSGPSQGSTVYTPQVTFVWSGNDTDGFINGYYYSFDRSPPDAWTTNTSVTSGILTEGSHTFRVIAMDDEGAVSTIASRTFTVSTGFMQANFSASPLSGTAPLSVQFTDLSTSISGITSGSWSFGDGGTSTSQNPSHIYSSTGSYTVTLTVTGPDGSDTRTRTNYITVSSIPSGPVYGWTRRMGGTPTDCGYGITTDGSGNIYVTGYFGGTVDFGTDFGTSESRTSQGLSDIFVTKINSGGSYGWTRIMGGGKWDRGYGIATDGSGNVYVTGRFESSVIDFGADFGVLDSKTSQGAYDIFVTKINSDGTYGWTRVMGGVSDDYGYGVATDPSGNVYVTGYFADTVDFGADFGTSDSKNSQGGGDIFVSKVNSDGTYGWTKAVGGWSDDYGRGIATDGSGSVYVTGYFKGIADFGADFGTADSKTSQGEWDIFVTKINSGGTYGWTKRMGGVSFDYGFAIATGPSGNVYVAGGFYNTVDFGADFGTSESKTSWGVEDVFVTKINSDSTYGWTKVMGGGYFDYQYGIAVDGLANIYVVGRFGDTVNFGTDFGVSDSKTSQGDFDIFVTKVNPDGSYGWTKAMGGPLRDTGYGITTDGLGNVYVTGNFESTVDFGADFGTSDSKTSLGSAEIFVTKIGQPGGNTIYVDGTSGNDTSSGLSWAQAVRTIQTGLDKAGASGWTVLVANGTYTGANNKNLDFGGKDIHLKSVGGAANCIIDCQSSGRGFYFQSGETRNAILEGFTIQNGNVFSEDGGGIFCDNNSTPTITSCIITGNEAGGTIGSGGGISCRYSDVLVNNCIIVNNTARAGGAVHCIGSNPVITNCIIANNAANYPLHSLVWGGGIFCSGSSPTINNSILWGNSAISDGNQIYVYDGLSTVTLNYCDCANAAGDIAGVGTTTLNNCINADPLFVNASAQDYHLQAGSPCIDAGNNSYVSGVTTDLDGNPRIVNTTVEIGAYERMPLDVTDPTGDQLSGGTSADITGIRGTYDATCVYLHVDFAGNVDQTGEIVYALAIDANNSGGNLMDAGDYMLWWNSLMNFETYDHNSDPVDIGASCEVTGSRLTFTIPRSILNPTAFGITVGIVDVIYSTSEVVDEAPDWPQNWETFTF